MSIALMFPGQGSQAVGMGRALAENFSAARQALEEIDAALGDKLTTIMWDGPAETLTLTENAQPALLAVSVAALRVLDTVGLLLGGAGTEAASIARTSSPSRAKSADRMLGAMR